MIELREQLELIRLKERIAFNAKMNHRLVKLLGQSKGWDELGEDWKLSRSMIRGLKDMAVCELCYKKSDFSILRMQAYEEAKKRLIHEGKQRPIAFFSTPKANVEVQYMSRKPIQVAAIAQGKMNNFSFDGTNQLETIQIKHDTNSPIFIFGDLVWLNCNDQRITECYFLHCQHIEGISLGSNRIKTIELHDSFDDLNNVDLRVNPIDLESVLQILSQVKPFTKQDLFDEDPTLFVTQETPGELYSLAKLKRWIVVNET